MQSFWSKILYIDRCYRLPGREYPADISSNNLQIQLYVWYAPLLLSDLGLSTNMKRVMKALVATSTILLVVNTLFD